VSLLTNNNYIGRDSIEDDLQASNNAVFEDPEFLNSLKVPGIPPHELILKVGAICRFTSGCWRFMPAPTSKFNVDVPKIWV
jgi:hypothetical protein